MAAAEVSTHTNVCCNVNIRVYKDRLTAASVGHFLQFAVQLLSPVSGLLAETILDGAARTCLSALPSILPDLLLTGTLFPKHLSPHFIHTHALSALCRPFYPPVFLSSLSSIFLLRCSSCSLLLSWRLSSHLNLCESICLLLLFSLVSESKVLYHQIHQPQLHLRHSVKMQGIFL